MIKPFHSPFFVLSLRVAAFPSPKTVRLGLHGIFLHAYFGAQYMRALEVSPLCAAMGHMVLFFFLQHITMMFYMTGFFFYLFFTCIEQGKRVGSWEAD